MHCGVCFYPQIGPMELMFAPKKKEPVHCRQLMHICLTSLSQLVSMWIFLFLFSCGCVCVCQFVHMISCSQNDDNNAKKKKKFKTSSVDFRNLSLSNWEASNHLVILMTLDWKRSERSNECNEHQYNGVPINIIYIRYFPSNGTIKIG